VGAQSHRKGILDILRCDPSREAVSQALRQWTAEDFQAEAAARNMCAAALQSPEEWDSHPQGIALAELPCVRLVRIGDAPKRVVGSVGNGRLPEWPLDGIRVLDLTRVLAGPVCGRTLAGLLAKEPMQGVGLLRFYLHLAHGADVLLITSPNLPALPLADIETSRGKRTTQLDLTLPEHRSTLISLAREADVFLQAYRPGGLSDKGFGTEDLTKMRPGIVYASLTAYGWEGPWRDRRGVRLCHC
jgi:crotonobetainyl-CoA:carnitine CoA-transferase CaiB-like acyl-CoA transferase